MPWIKFCKECKKRMVVKKRRQQTCSKYCNGKRQARLASAEFKFRRSQLGGRASGLVRKRKRDGCFQLWIEKYGAIEATRRAYEMGYSAGHRSRRYYEVSEGMKHDVA